MVKLLTFQPTRKPGYVRDEQTWIGQKIFDTALDGFIVLFIDG